MPEQDAPFPVTVEVVLSETTETSTPNVVLRELSPEELTFAFAVLEFPGNAAAAYRAAFGDVPYATAKALALMLLKDEAVLERINELRTVEYRHAAVTKESSAGQLAILRDIAATMGQVKAAIHAETKRGELYGLYALPEKEKVDTSVNISINVGGKVVTLKEYHEESNVIDV